jgi:hypothetical protein
MASSMVLHSHCSSRNSRLIYLLVGAPVTRPTLNSKDQGLYFFWPLPFDLSLTRLALPGAYAPADVVTGDGRIPLHDKAVVLEDRRNLYKDIGILWYILQCVPFAGSPGKSWFTKRTKVNTFACHTCNEVRLCVL